MHETAITLTRRRSKAGDEWDDESKRPFACDYGLRRRFTGIPTRPGAKIRLHLTQEYPGAEYAVLLEGSSGYGTCWLRVNNQDTLVHLGLYTAVRRFPDRWCYAWIEIL